MAVLLLAGCGGKTADPSTGTQADLVLTGVTVIDGLGSPPVPNQTVEIRAGRIASVRSASDEDVGLDLSGHYVTPGLIDTHQHLPGWDEVAVRDTLESLLNVGVTSVREMAGFADVYARVSAETDSSAIPRLYWSALWADSVYMANDRRASGAPGAGVVPWMFAVSADTDLDEAVRDVQQSGATSIKVYSNVSPSLLAEIVRVAHSQGLQVWTHPVVFPTRPSEVIGSGIDVVSHSALFVWEGAQQLPSTYNGAHEFNAFGPPAPYSTVRPDDPGVLAVLEEVRDRGIILDATVSTIAGSVHEEASAWAVEVTKLAHSMGIPISIGTDNGTAGATAFFLELEMLVEWVGLTPLEAIESATSIGAAVLGVQNDFGSLDVGKAADLVIYANDPTEDISRLRDPVYVIKGGRLVRSPEAG